MQDSNIQALYEPLHSQLETLEVTLTALVEEMTEKLKGPVTRFDEQETILLAKIAEVEDELQKISVEKSRLPLPPTRTNATRVVNQTLRNKNNTTKLQMLGNLAGTPSLFSKKQNRIAQGRLGLIDKQFTLQQKNYQTTVKPKRDALQKKTDALYMQLGQLQDEREANQREFESESYRLGVEATSRMNPLYKEFQSIRSKVEQYRKQHANTLFSSFTNSLTTLVNDVESLTNKISTQFAPFVNL